MKRSDFSFDLPEALIAQQPPAQRGHSRLLDCSKGQGQLKDRQFRDIAELFQPNDCLVINNTKVLKARLPGQKASGGKIEVMLERIHNDRSFTAMIRASKAPKPGSQVHLPGNTVATVTGRNGMMFELAIDHSELSLPDLLDQHGSIPLPPYISHEATEQDNQRYQTVFAQEPGAVAAPTAGLHFTEELLVQLQQRGVNITEVTLHVGAGTFLPVKEDDVSNHQMHRERFAISGQTIAQLRATKAAGGRIVCVGTTSMRTLEAWTSETGLDLGTASGLKQAREYENTGYTGDTDIFIRPGYEFKASDCLITNFHLPESTLLMLVCAFAGKPLIDAAYAHAIEEKYRFFSYGDAMWLNRSP